MASPNSLQPVSTENIPGLEVTIARPADQSVSQQRIGRFEVRSILGSGAFGRVYRAFDPSLDREVALKVPLAESVQAATDRDRFLKEARAAATVAHPNICQIHEVGEHEGQPFIVMAFVPGQTLAEVLRGRAEPLPERQAAIIVHKLALALDAAHKKGVVHRDLKPANVMFDKERNELVVMDFGLARRSGTGEVSDTQSGVVMGTPAYMSPEQASGGAKDVGPATDIFSLGIIMYELLTGSRPFTGSAHEVIGRIILMEPEPPSSLRPGIHPLLAAACMKALAKDPAARFASMSEFADAVDGYLHPSANANAELAWAVEEKPDTNNEVAVSTDTRKLAELFAVVSQQREIAKAETAAVLEAAAERHNRTERRYFVAFAITLVVGLATIAALVVYFSQNRTVKVTVELKGVNLDDPRLSFTLDTNPITAEALKEPIELTPGEHEIIVFRDTVPKLRFPITVTGGRNPRAESREAEEVPPSPTQSASKPEIKQPDPKPVPKLSTVEEGFVPIFNGKDLTGWGAGTHPEAFKVDADGNLAVKGDAKVGELFWLLTEKEYADYILRLEFQFDDPLPKDTHSGVAIRSGRNHLGVRGMQLEVQLQDTAKGALSTGAVIFGEGNAKKTLKPIDKLATGSWHTLELEVRWPKVKVTIDGKLVNDVDLTKFFILRSWAKVELERKKGHIGLQSWRNMTKFRNIRVKELPAVPASAIVSTFDKDHDGWAVVGDTSGGAIPKHHKDGGNPGGYVSAQDNAVGGVWYWVAPIKFLGDRSSSYGQALSFDLTQSATDSPFEEPDVILEGEKMTLVFKLPKHPDTKWTSYKVPLTALKGWKVKATAKDATEVELKAVLKSLKRLLIRGEYRNGDDRGQLDNVTLEQQPAGGVLQIVPGPGIVPPPGKVPPPEEVVAYDSKTKGAVEVRVDNKSPTDWFSLRLPNGESAYKGNPPLLNNKVELAPGSYVVDVNGSERKVTIEAGKKTVLWTGELIVEGEPKGAFWWPMDGEKKLGGIERLLNRAMPLFPGSYTVFVSGNATLPKKDLGKAEVKAGQKTVLKHQ